VTARDATAGAAPSAGPRGARRARVAVLRSDDWHHRYLAALLGARFHLVADVVEPAACQRRRLLRLRRYRDWWWHVYHSLRRRVLGLDAYRARAFALPGPAPAPTLEVEWINHPGVVEHLERARPDVTVVICTSLLRSPVLAAAGETVLNVHGGFLPYYRGNYCFFWALYHGAFDRLGSTIHFVNEGLDTGDIVEVVVPAIRPDDSAETLYCRTDHLAFERLVELLEGHERGEPLPRRPQPIRGSLYLTRHRKPHHDLLLWLRRATGRLVLPSRPAPATEQVEAVQARPMGEAALSGQGTTV
jgi:methionyl-tRNA formyltransferase